MQIDESFFSVMCAALIAFLFGMALIFGGYRFFLFLLPIFGFFFGLALGVHTIEAIFPSGGFFSTVTSWVVGFVVGVIFAVLSYLFYFVAVAVIAGALGYAIGTGLMYAITPNFGLLVWLVGIVGAVVLIGVTLFFNLQKWVIMIATAVLGSSIILGGFLLLFNPDAAVLNNPVQVALNNNPLLLILFIVLAAAGVFVQWRSGRAYTVATYNRWDDMTVTNP
jgi:hypothetical protein